MPFKSSDFSAVSVFWLLVGFAIGLIVGMWSPPSIFDVPEECANTAFWCFLYTWQTLLAGLLALIGALVGAYFLWGQITLQLGKEEQEQKRKEIAARLQLPHALSNINGYLKECYKCWIEDDYSNFPSFPDAEISRVIDAALNCDGRTFDAFQECIEYSQRFRSGVEGFKSEGLKERKSFLLEILKLLFLIEKFYEYGRFKVEHLEVCTFSRENAEYVLNQYFGYQRRDFDVAQRTRIKQVLDEHSIFASSW